MRNQNAKESTEITNSLASAIDKIVMSGGNVNVLDILFDELPNLSDVQGHVFSREVYRVTGDEYKRKHLIKN